MHGADSTRPVLGVVMKGMGRNVLMRFGIGERCGWGVMENKF